VWVTYAFLTAFFLATSDALTKKALTSRDEYLIAWLRLLFSLPVLLGSLLFIEIPHLDTTFWSATLIALPLEIIAIILYIKALKSSPLSLTIPFLALTPLFLIILSYVILGEKVSVGGAIGIILIAIGSYTLNIHKVRHEIMEPIKAIFREPGSVMMIIVAFIFSITSSLGKMAIEHSSPIFFGSLYFVLITLVFTPIAIAKNKGRIIPAKKDMIQLLTIGVTYSLMVIFHMVAMSLTNVAYMISVKRMSLIFSIIYGHILFKEEKITERVSGGTIMFIGVVMIILSS